jgi:hypothetical protein
MEKFENLPDVKRLSPGIYLLHRVYVKLAVNDSEIEIVSLNSVRRGGGFGNWCLSTICEIADRTNTRLSLTPMQFDGGPMDVEALRAWYSRHDFKQVDGTRMLRLPCGAEKRKT